MGRTRSAFQHQDRLSGLTAPRISIWLIEDMAGQGQGAPPNCMGPNEHPPGGASTKPPTSSTDYLQASRFAPG